MLLASIVEYAYIIRMNVEWNSSKATANLQKHGVTFDEAVTVLLDPMALVQGDEDSEGESRWVVIGSSAKTRLLTVVYTVRIEDIIRIISARKSTRKEAKYYA